MSSHQNKMATLRAAIPGRLPYSSGVYSSTRLNFDLFYGKDGMVSRLDLSKASPSGLEHLLKACSPVTFGINQTTLRGELPSDLKMGKLEHKDFAVKFDLAGSGIVDHVRSELLQGEDDKKRIEAELCTLNVYGKDAYFKSRKDLPSDGLEKKFGTLIIIFPTLHDGGTLGLRHADQEWSFNAANAIFGKPDPTIGYIAFHRDVERDLGAITEGYRVTLTYNLYFSPSGPAAKDLGLVPTTFEFGLPLKTALSQLVEDSDFLPEGGILGFGLRHTYQIGGSENKDEDEDEDEDVYYKKKNPLDTLIGQLKGNDALIVQIAKELSLPVSLKVIYETDDGGFLSDSILDVTGHGFSEFTFSLVDMLQEYFDVKFWEIREDGNHEDNDDDDSPITWVTDLTEFNKVKTSCTSFDHKRTTTHDIYGTIFLSVVLESAEKRGEAKQKREAKKEGAAKKGGAAKKRRV